MTQLTALCPQCNSTLFKVVYPGGYLNYDQWDSQRAGDWYCNTCPPNDRSAGNRYCYWWNREVIKEPLLCSWCGLDLWEEHSERICKQRLMQQRDDAIEQRDRAIHLLALTERR